MWVKCEVGCEKIQLSSLLGKTEMTFRTTQYIFSSLTKFADHWHRLCKRKIKKKRNRDQLENREKLKPLLVFNSPSIEVS
jgi:hypothetical protein